MQAKHEQFSNDLFWTYYHFKKDFEDFHKITWTGYHDEFWWANVAPARTIKRCECGKIFKIDFRSSMIEDVTEKEKSNHSMEV